MNKVNFIGCAVVGLLSFTPITFAGSFQQIVPAQAAACPKPLGTYVAISSGDLYQGNPSTLYNHSTMVLTVKFNANGSGSYNMISKDTVASLPYRKYGATGTFASINFDSTLCRGFLNPSTGGTTVFTSAMNGNEVDWADYSDNDGVGLVVFHLKKASSQ